MLILIHGQDNILSRKKLREKLKSENHEIVYLDGKKLDLSQLLINCEAGSLFAKPKIIVIENLFKKNAGKGRGEILEYLSNLPEDLQVIIWEDRKIDKTKLKKLPAGLRLEEYDLPRILFKFLDSLGSQPIQVLIEQYHDLLKTDEAQRLFLMIVRQFRYLLMAKDQSKNSLSIPDWQFYKFRRQAQYFSFSELKSHYRQLLSIDHQVKTGQTPLQLDKLLDIFLVNL